MAPLDELVERLCRQAAEKSAVLDERAGLAVKMSIATGSLAGFRARASPMASGSLSSLKKSVLEMPSGRRRAVAAGTACAGQHRQLKPPSLLS